MTEKLEDIAVVICGTGIALGLLLLVIVYSPGMVWAKLINKKRTEKPVAHPCIGCKYYFGKMGLTCAVNPGSADLCVDFTPPYSNHTY